MNPALSTAAPALYKLKPSETALQSMGDKPIISDKVQPWVAVIPRYLADLRARRRPLLGLEKAKKVKEPVFHFNSSVGNFAEIKW